MGLFKNLFNKPYIVNGVRLDDISKFNNPDEGFEDVVLNIVSETVSGSTFHFIAKGLYKQTVVGLNIEIIADFEAGISSEEVINPKAFTQNGVTIRSIGNESNDLIKALSILYKLPITSVFSHNPVVATVFSLNQSGGSLRQKGQYKFKLFFETPGMPYAELFLNINTMTQKIEFAEKDLEYRQAIIANWTK